MPKITNNCKKIVTELSKTATKSTLHSIFVPLFHSSPCTSLQQSLLGVKRLTLEVWGGGSSISEPRVPWKKEELHKQSLKPGLCSLSPHPMTSGVTGHNALPSGTVLSAPRQRGRIPTSRFQAELCEAIQGLRTVVLLWQGHHSHQLCSVNSASPLDHFR